MTDPSRSTPSEATVLRAWGRSLQAEIRVSLVGTVTAYDAATRMATVQPVMRQPDGEPIPPLRDVRVGQLRAGPFVVSLPVAVGDVVELRFLDYSHDEFLADGALGRVPDALRRHALSDAVALPLALSPETIAAASADHLVLGLADGSATLTLRDDGRVDVTSADIRLGSSSASDAVVLAQELATYLGQLDGALAASFSALGGSYTPPSPKPSGATRVKGQ